MLKPIAHGFENDEPTHWNKQTRVFFIRVLFFYKMSQPWGGYNPLNRVAAGTQGVLSWFASLHMSTSTELPSSEGLAKKIVKKLQSTQTRIQAGERHYLIDNRMLNFVAKHLTQMLDLQEIPEFNSAVFEQSPRIAREVFRCNGNESAALPN